MPATWPICRPPGRASARCSPPTRASTSPASSKARKAAYRMILEAFWKGDLDGASPASSTTCLRDLRRGRRSSARRTASSSTTGWSTIEQALIAEAPARPRRGRRHRPLRSRYRRGHPQHRGRGGRRLAERRGPDPRPLDLPPRHLARAIPTGCWSKPTRKSERRTSRALALAPSLILSACATRPRRDAAGRRRPHRPRRRSRRRPSRRSAAPGQCGRGRRRAGRAAAVHDRRPMRAARCGLPDQLPGAAPPPGPVGPDPARLGAHCAPSGDSRACGCARPSSATFRLGPGRRRARPSPPAITSPRSRARATPLPGYEVPIYRDAARPGPLHRADGTARARPDRRDRHCVLYYTRAEIEDGALAGRGLEIAWAADPVELFFLQIQGSGRLRLPDGSVMRIGYADQNGREYVAIGRLLRDAASCRRAAPTCRRSRPGCAPNPEEGRALMRENLTYIFFQELTGPGPLGALGRAGDPAGTVAADPKFVPLGRAGVPDARPARGQRPVGGAGYRRGDQGRQPLRHLLGRGRRGDARSPAACRPRARR